ncbi:hypothetical protein K457DRAFT_18503 [Linnemannia elongata AG-77]|uniref:Stealth protein CR3 conserved region 3 domain-containing protein n=1 Tax=Linnemannia elongata AG-77 TaxID=1314771 RepID=A0A197K111_9FUNG|nr:hypothetical protein K457DRAFT_18503 [Linnemannia elongata AG-77]
MEFAKKYGTNRTEALKKGMKDGDKYIVADEEPPVRPFVRRRTGPSEEVGQVPSWLDRSLASREKIDVTHHSTFFKNKDNLPVFCSVAIESQLYRISDLSEVFIYMNDDEYFGMELAQSDFWTPHYGLLLQMNPAILVAPRPRDHGNIDPLSRGYIDNLQFTNYILSKRFGSRFRPILDHIVQVGSRSILKEIESLWPEAFLQTEKSHFRTDYDGHTVLAMFLMAHYTIERLRETQLRSFWRYRVDNNANGDLEWEERWALVSLFEDWNASGGGVNRERTGQVINHTPQFLSGFRQVLEKTGYGDTQKQPATRYLFSGMEGFPFLIPDANTSKTIHHDSRLEASALQKLNAEFSIMPADRTCIFDVDFCLGPMFLERRGSLRKKEGEKIFRRVAFEEFHCGDCLLQIALHSDRGVEYFLERIGDAEESDWGEYVPFVSRKRPAAPIANDDNRRTGGVGNSDENADNSENANNKDDANADNPQNPANTTSTKSGDPQASSGDADNADNAATIDTTSETNTDTKKRDAIPFCNIIQKILAIQSQTPYTPHTHGISAILPHPSHHPKARLRIMRDLYRYNFVLSESDSFFVTLDGLEEAQKDMAFLDKVKEKEKKLHVICLNDGIIEERNGTEVRALLTGFLEDRYGDPAPWEKMAVDT